MHDPGQWTAQGTSVHGTLARGRWAAAGRSTGHRGSWYVHLRRRDPVWAKRNPDAGTVEGFLEPRPELSRDIHRHQRCGLDHHADGEGVAGHGFDAEDLGFLDDLALPLLVRGELIGDPLDNGVHL